jgi:hypothetical protein
MKPKYIILILAVQPFLVSLSQSGDFRNNDWGDTPAEVEYYEGEVFPWIVSGPYSNNKRFTGGLFYRAMHLGIRGDVFFEFTPEEKLGMGFCLPFAPELSSFYYWEKELSRLYGEPENRDEILTDDEAVVFRYYGADARAVEEGVLKGYFALVRYWETEKTHIWLAAEMAEDKVMVYIKYHSKEYFDLYRDEEEKGKPGPRRGLPPWFDTENR